MEFRQASSVTPDPEVRISSEQGCTCCHTVSYAIFDTTVALSTYSDMKFYLDSFCSLFSEGSPGIIGEDMRHVLSLQLP